MFTCKRCHEPIHTYDSGITLHVRSQEVDCSPQAEEPTVLVELPPLPEG